MTDYRHVLSHFYGACWAILPAKLAEIEAVLWRRISGGPQSAPSAFDDGGGQARSSSPGYTLVGSAAVVPVNGTITPRPSLFADWSGGTSSESIGRAVEAAANDPKAEAIVLDIDSPGGYVAGIPEAADKILAARKVKPIHAVANHLAASAAYWLASQATDIAVSPSAQVGSVGVLAAHVDETKAEELAGVKTTLVHNTQSPFKTEGYPQIPLTDEGRADMQKAVDDYAQMFLAAVSRGRGQRQSVVEKNYGQGRVKLAEEAVASGMADKVATLEDVINRVNKVRTDRTRRRVAADLAAAGLPTT